MASIAVRTPRCPVCGVHSILDLPIEGVEKYNAGAFIQDAFPEIPPEQREMLMTGIHPDCWKKSFPDEEEVAEVEEKVQSVEEIREYLIKKGVPEPTADTLAFAIHDLQQASHYLAILAKPGEWEFEALMGFQSNVQADIAAINYLVVQNW